MHAGQLAIQACPGNAPLTSLEFCQDLSRHFCPPKGCLTHSHCKGIHVLRGTGGWQGPQIRALASDPRVLRSRGSQVSKGQIEWPELSLRWMINTRICRHFLGPLMGQSGWEHCITSSSPHFTDKKAHRDEVPCPQPPSQGFWGWNPDLGVLN